MNGQGAGEQTLSQKRATYALAEVKAIAGMPHAKEFRSYAAGLPPMIQMNGFGQALAFCNSKDDGAYQALYRLVSNWLTRDDQPYAGHTDVLAGITTESMSVYRLAQTESMALLDWVKRFASAYLKTAAAAAEEPADTAAGGAAGPVSR